MSIIIFLSVGTLKVYSFDKKVLNLNYQVRSDIKNLDLANNFENIWSQIWFKFLHIQKSDLASPIYFLISESSGFTNTRTIYIWLKTWQLLSQNVFFVHKVSDRLLLEILKKSEITNFLESIKQVNNQEILYSNEVRIGQKTQS